MKTTKAILLTLGLAAIMTACGNHADKDLSGSWTSAAPINVTKTVAGATSATKTLAVDFTAPTGDAAGEVTLTADYDVTAPVVTDSVTESRSYKVTASVRGTYSRVKGEDDEYLLTFDKNTVDVQGTDAPELGPVTDDFISSLDPLTSIEDVEISKDGNHLTFDTDHPDVHYHFVKK